MKAVAAPAKSCAPDPLDALQSRKLHGWLFRVVCSSRWEDDLYSMFVGGRIPIGATGERTIRTLHSKQIYPPGGPQTRMRRCSACRLWVSPLTVGSADICLDCHCGNVAISEPTEMAQWPSSHRYTWIVPGKEAKAYLAGQFVRAQRSQRVRYCNDDPRTVGGRIDVDGTMHDPWLGQSPSQLPAVAPAA